MGVTLLLSASLGWSSRDEGIRSHGSAIVCESPDPPAARLRALTTGPRGCLSLRGPRHLTGCCRGSTYRIQKLCQIQ